MITNKIDGQCPYCGSKELFFKTNDYLKRIHRVDVYCPKNGYIFTASENIDHLTTDIKVLSAVADKLIESGILK